MNALRVLYAMAFWALASVSAAAPITYHFSVTDFDSAFTGTSGPNDSISGSFEVDNDLLLGIDLTINGYAYSASEVEFYKDSWMLGATLCAFNCISAHTNDFLLEVDVSTLSFFGFTYTLPNFNDIWYSSTGTLSIENVEVPEPGSFLLMLLALCGLAIRQLKIQR